MENIAYADVCDAAYWRSLCPNLRITSAIQHGVPQVFQHDPGSISKRLSTDGYSILSNPVEWPVDLRKVEHAVHKLVEAGWPASFIMMFDEPWLLMHSMSELMLKETGNAPNMDMLAWRVDAAKGEAGFAPHRDRQPDDAPASFRSDGTAQYTSCWLAVTDATPDTSCLYVIPRGKDPGYLPGDPEDDGAPDPLHAALPCKEAFQHVRALPCARGEAVVFTHRIIHWGSAGTAHGPGPRISLSFGFSDDAFEAPYFGRKHLPLPPLHLRLALVSAQMLTYYQRFPPSAGLLSLYKAAVDKASTLLEPQYRRKVLAEFVRAARELHEKAGDGQHDATGARGGRMRAAQAEGGGSAAARASGDVGDEGDDVVDAAMDAMLDAELEGQHDFEDDFDALSGEGAENDHELGVGENEGSDVEVGDNDEELPAASRAAAAADAQPEDAERADENPDMHPGAAAHAHALHAPDQDDEDDGGTPRGSENAVRNAGRGFRNGDLGAGGVQGMAVAPARMAAGNAGVLRVDSHSMRSAGGEESTVLCAMDAFDEASIGEACTSRAAPWEFGGMLVWGKKRKR